VEKKCSKLFILSHKLGADNEACEFPAEEVEQVEQQADPIDEYLPPVNDEYLPPVENELREYLPPVQDAKLKKRQVVVRRVVPVKGKAVRKQVVRAQRQIPARRAAPKRVQKVQKVQKVVRVNRNIPKRFQRQTVRKQ
jgi:hypothetical protein